MDGYECYNKIRWLLAVTSTRDFAGIQACRLPHSPKLAHEAGLPAYT